MKKTILLFLAFGIIGVLQAQQDTITLPDLIVAEIGLYNKESKPILVQIKDLELEILKLRAQLESKRSNVNGQIKGFLIGQGESRLFALTPDNKKVILQKE